MRKVLIVLEVALALMALVPAGLMIKWLKNINNVDLGFRPEHVLTAQIALRGNEIPRPSPSRRFLRSLARTAFAHFRK